MNEFIVQYFYNVKSGPSIIRSKDSSKNLSNENKHTMFPENWHFNSLFVLKTTKSQVFAMITKIFWRTFWRNKWTSVFGVVKDSSYIGKNIFTTNLDKYINKIVFLKCIISYHFIGGVGAIEVTVTPPAFGDTISVSASKIVFSIAFVFRTLRD